MDTLIILLILACAIMLYRRKPIDKKWAVVFFSIALLATLILFRIHVTSVLNLNF